MEESATRTYSLSRLMRSDKTTNPANSGAPWSMRELTPRRNFALRGFLLSFYTIPNNALLFSRVQEET